MWYERRFMKRPAAVIVILLFIALLRFTVLNRGALPRADFTYAIGDTIKTLDPAHTAWNEDIRMALALWEGLATYHPKTTKAISGAAHIPPQISTDRLTYTFELRQDARWSNGDQVTANDFVYAWRRAIEPGTAHVYAFLIVENIAGAKEYSHWRNRAVRALGIMKDLARAKDISEQDEQFIRSLHLPGTEQEKPDWLKIAGRFRENHIAQMNREFEKVEIKALDDFHLQVRLVRPTAYFLDLVAFSTFLPVHKASIEKLRVTDDPAVTDLTLWVFDPQWVKPDYHRNGYPGLVSNGAFTITDWQFKRYMLFKKNPYYWDRKNVKSETIMARIIPEASTAFLAYERGETDWLRDLTRLDFAPALVEKTRQGQRNDIHICPAFGTYFYYFNCQKHLPDGSENPFADARVRMAFNLAVDKQAIVDKVKKIGNTAARNFVPPNTIEGYSCPPGPEYNPDQARILLAEAGYADGTRLPTIEILYNKGYGHEKVAEAIGQMWAEILHAKVVLKGKEMKSFDEDKTNHRFVVCRASWYGDYSDPTTFLDMMITGNGQNDAAFSNNDYDRLMRQASECRNQKQRFEILAKAEKMLVQEQVPFLPVYYYVNLLAYREHVKGLYLNAREMHPFKYIYVDK